MLGTLRSLLRPVTRSLGSALVVLPALGALVLFLWVARGLDFLGLDSDTAGLIGLIVMFAGIGLFFYAFATRVIDWD